MTRVTCHVSVSCDTCQHRFSTSMFLVPRAFCLTCQTPRTDRGANHPCRRACFCMHPCFVVPLSSLMREHRLPIKKASHICGAAGTHVNPVFLVSMETSVRGSDLLCQISVSNSHLQIILWMIDDEGALYQG